MTKLYYDCLYYACRNLVIKCGITIDPDAIDWTASDIKSYVDAIFNCINMISIDEQKEVRN